MKKLFIGLMALLMVVVMVSCGAKDPRKGKEKTFSIEELSITLTNAFKETSMVGYTKVYDSSKVGIFVLKEPFVLFGDDSLTLDEYAQMVLKANSNKAENSQVKTTDGLTYIEYSYNNNGVDYAYFTVMYRATSAFWIVQFSCTESDLSEYRPYFINWAKTVTFA